METSPIKAVGVVSLVVNEDGTGGAIVACQKTTTTLCPCLDQKMSHEWKLFPVVSKKKQS